MATSPALPAKEPKYKNEIIRRMKAIGTYRKEYTPTIERLAVLYKTCQKIDEQFIASGGNAVIRHTNKAGASNLEKNPYLTARDMVYTQILAHERELGLTPAALKKIGMSAISDKKPTALAQALANLSFDD